MSLVVMDEHLESDNTSKSNAIVRVQMKETHDGEKPNNVTFSQHDFFSHNMLIYALLLSTCCIYTLFKKLYNIDIYN